MPMLIHDDGDMIVGTLEAELSVSASAEPATVDVSLDTGIATITDAPNSIAPADAVQIDGRNLGSAVVTIGGEEQTLDTQTDTQITLTAQLGTLSYGMKTLEVNNSAGSDSKEIDFTPAAGFTFVIASGSLPSGGQETLFPTDVSSGDQCEYESTTQQGDSVTVNADGTFEIDGTGPQAFEARLWDGEWNQFQTITINYDDGVFLELQAERATTSGSISSEHGITVSLDAGRATTNVEMELMPVPGFEVIEIQAEPATTAITLDTGAQISAELEARPASASASLEVPEFEESGLWDERFPRFDSWEEV